MGELNCVGGKCLIQGGTFMMRFPAGIGDKDLFPPKQVTVTTFRMGQTEVSIGDYKRYLAQTSSIQLRAVLRGCATGEIIKTIQGDASETKEQFRKRASQVFVSEQCGKLEFEQIEAQGLPMERFCGKQNSKSDDYPVVCLTMPEKEAYCHAQGGELMTAAQFAYTTRFDAQDSRPNRLVVSGYGNGATVPVGSGFQNRFGVFNLFGNVWESMRDANEDDFYFRMPGTDPYNPLTDPSHQFEDFRGGHASFDRRYATSGFGLYERTNSRNSIIGFRCVWPHDPEPPATEKPPVTK